MSFIRVLRYFPFANDLMSARGRDHIEALKEVALNVILSTTPIWLSAIFMGVVKSQSLVDNLLLNLGSGELYLYSTALLAPLYYFVFQEYGESAFPWRRFFMVVSLVIFMIATLFFTLRKSIEVFTLSINLAGGVIFYWSLAIYGISVVLVYIAHVYKNMLPGAAPDIDRATTDAFVERFRGRRGGADS